MSGASGSQAGGKPTPSCGRRCVFAVAVFWIVPFGLYCLFVNAFETYSAFGAPLTRIDVRVRIVLFLVYAVMLFVVDTWAGLAVAAIAFVGVFASARVELKSVLLPAIPVYVLVGFMLVSSSLVFVAAGQGIDPAQGAALAVAGQGAEFCREAAFAAADQTVGFAQGTLTTQADLYELAGPLCFSLDGFQRGCFFAVRIVLLVWMCLVLAITVDAVELANAVRWFMTPLAKLGLPVDDAAVMISIAIRFIPIMGEEFSHIRAAQWSRGGLSDEGGLVKRIKAWGAVLMPLIVGLFRRAEALGVAMDARCYGASAKRTSLSAKRFDKKSCAALVVGLLLALIVGVFL